MTRTPSSAALDTVAELLAGDLMAAATLGARSAWMDAEGTIDNIGGDDMLATLLVRMPDAADPEATERIVRWLRAVSDWLEREDSIVAAAATEHNKELVHDAFAQLDDRRRAKAERRLQTVLSASADSSNPKRLPSSTSR